MSGFPLLLIPLAVCNIIVFLMPGVSFAAPLFTLPLISGTSWTVTLSDALLAFGLFLLLLEILKSARVGGKYVTDHILALVIFGGAAAEFVMLPQFANATFFLLTMIALVDFVSGLGLRRPRARHVRETVAAAPVEESVVIHEPAAPRMAPMAPVPDAIPIPLHEPERVAPVMQPARVEPIIDTVPVHEPSDRPRPTIVSRDGV